MTVSQTGPATGTALDAILAYKADEVAAASTKTPLSEIKARLGDAPPPRGFKAALDAVVARGENGLICELKRKSPSAGDILPGADPVAIAKDYEAGGAACLSILTDGPSFGGSLADLSAIRSAVTLPVLRKDFMVDPYQVYEARAHGADAILVIMAALPDTHATDLMAAAFDLGMDVLVETHNKAELTRALDLDSRGLIGVNNRDLTRMITDLSTTESLAPLIPSGRPFVAESGVKSAADIQRLKAAGARRFLVGESLMLSPDRRASTARLRAA
ncbi:MAG: indole-3-glycerol phosphate synthase TrpC [Pseudomonadota bacterium]